MPLSVENGFILNSQRGKRLCHANGQAVILLKVNAGAIVLFVER
jgi:hypothetical protein